MQHSNETLFSITESYSVKFFITDGQTLNLTVREIQTYIQIAHTLIYFLFDFGQDRDRGSWENAKNLKALSYVKDQFWNSFWLHNLTIPIPTCLPHNYQYSYLKIGIKTRDEQWNSNESEKTTQILYTFCI